jgi:predicted amidophosphoribosyltransferase
VGFGRLPYLLPHPRYRDTIPTVLCILIDDVFTYGRVSEAARRLVTDAGAADVLVACLARTRL